MQENKILRIIPPALLVISLFLFGLELAETGVYGEMINGSYVSYYKRFTSYEIIFGGQGLPSNGVLIFGFIVLLAAIAVNVYKFFQSNQIVHFISMGTTVLSAFILNPLGYFAIFEQYNYSNILGPRSTLTINNIFLASIILILLFGAAFIVVSDYIVELYYRKKK